MLKKTLIILSIMTLLAPVGIAATQEVTPEVARGIRNYKTGNYVGCIEEMSAYIKKQNKATNQLATYYLGMSYMQAGNVDKAKKWYEVTKNLNPGNTLAEYADKGLVCINTPEDCYIHHEHEQNTVQVKSSELDKFINAPYGNGLSADLNKELERQRVEKLRKDMNSSDELNKYEFKDFRIFETAPKKKSYVDRAELSAKNLLASSKPSDKEVLHALKVLNEAGYGNIAKQAQANYEKQNEEVTIEETQFAPKLQQQTQKAVNPQYKPDLTQEEYQRKLQKEFIQAQIEAMAQPNINALFGDNNNQNNNNMMNNNMMNNNMMMNMLPLMMMQQGQMPNGGQPAISPEMMQSIMLNSMMPGLNFGVGNQ